jgi:hypothetical protein
VFNARAASVVEIVLSISLLSLLPGRTSAVGDLLPGRLSPAVQLVHRAGRRSSEGVSALVCPMAFSRYDLEFGMRPHEALHRVEDLIDAGDIGRYGGKSEEGTLAKILVI